MSTGAQAPELAPSSSAQRAERLQQEFAALNAKLGALIAEERTQAADQPRGAAPEQRGEERRRQLSAACTVLQSLQSALTMWESCE